MDEPVRGAYDAGFSYAREDQAFVRRLHTHLEAKGLSLFLDILDLGPGEAWTSGLARKLCSAPCVLVVVSEHFNKKDWTRYELDNALAHGPTDRLIPVLRADHAHIPEPLRHLNAVDMRLDQDFDEGADVLAARLRGQPTGPIRRHYARQRGEKPDIPWEVPTHHRAPLRAYLEWVASTFDDLRVERDQATQRLSVLYVRLHQQAVADP
ncbi:MAG: toll/interleukin-1 receptor domain-containing protein [Deltaproteobacteria bacterium]|nr:toll/interleukin-1 receptor domain-containing protein [Deltaproteobacteria bacterium]